MEFVQINHLADKPAWLVIGLQSMASAEAHISAYLRPDGVESDVQRAHPQVEICP